MIESSICFIFLSLNDGSQFYFLQYTFLTMLETRNQTLHTSLTSRFLLCFWWNQSSVVFCAKVPSDRRKFSGSSEMTLHIKHMAERIFYISHQDCHPRRSPSTFSWENEVHLTDHDSRHITYTWVGLSQPPWPGSCWPIGMGIFFTLPSTWMISYSSDISPSDSSPKS